METREEVKAVGDKIEALLAQWNQPYNRAVSPYEWSHYFHVRTQWGRDHSCICIRVSNHPSQPGSLVPAINIYPGSEWSIDDALMALALISIDVKGFVRETKDLKRQVIGKYLGDMLIEHKAGIKRKVPTPARKNLAERWRTVKDEEHYI